MAHVDLQLDRSRVCPLCGGRPRGTTFPFSTVFNGSRFHYMECANCRSVFVDPVPNSETFALMYAKADYHDHHYQGTEEAPYRESARLLRAHLPQGSRVLDYGCGTGAFLKALGAEGFNPFGVEFDKDAAAFAGRNARCETVSVDEFMGLVEKPVFDAIHLGDVLEHMPDPGGTLTQLLQFLRPGGLLFAEGPLETNPSPVYWAARTFGAIKHVARKDLGASGKPTHLFRTGAKQQRDFFLRVEPALAWKHWSVYETGWPYASGGRLKRSIANVAVAVGGRQLLAWTFGNRFRAILSVSPRPE